MRERLEEIQARYSGKGETHFEVRGRGMVQGLAFMEEPALADRTTAGAFKRGLVIETSGSEGHVVKCLPALTIEEELMDAGLDILEESIEFALGRKKPVTLAGGVA